MYHIIFLVYNHYLDQLLKFIREFGKEFKIIIFDKKSIEAIFYNKNKYILELERG